MTTVGGTLTAGAVTIAPGAIRSDRFAIDDNGVRFFPPPKSPRPRYPLKPAALNSAVSKVGDIPAPGVYIKEAFTWNA